MSEPAGVLQHTATAPAKKAEIFSKKETPEIIDLDKELNFFGGQCQIHVANQLILRQNAYELIHDLYSQMGIVREKGSGL